MIDSQGFRANVGIILVDDRRRVFWGKRVGQDAWQFAQGGVNENETLQKALFRELREELGLKSSDVEVVAQTKSWLRYRLPDRLVRRDTLPLCIGQKQKWFLLKLKSEDEAVRFDCASNPEFDDWRWVNYWYPLRQVVSFKREVYRRALRELAPYVFSRKVDKPWLDSLSLTRKSDA